METRTTDLRPVRDVETRATGALVRVEMDCIQIPLESEYTGADVAVDFSLFDVAGRRIDLPSHSRVHFGMQRGDTTNEADYSAYRLAEFGTDTQIKFGDESGEKNRQDFF